MHGRLPRGRFREWFRRNRTSPRFAFILRALTLALGALLGLWWARVLVRTLGEGLYGMYLAFTRVAQLGGLGDLGISGAVGIRTLQHLARGEEEKCRTLLANARGVFLIIGVVVILVFALLAPWMPGWLGFKPLPNAGSLTLLFVLGGIGAGLLIISGYFQNLNYAHGNVVWPIVPAFLLTQAAFVAQWFFARHGAPLWIQYSASVVTALLGTVCAVWMLKASHAWLGDLWPIRLNWSEMRSLVKTSFWVYLGALGSLVYLTTDELLVNKGFGPERVPAYRFNYKLCELTVMFLVSASFVALPAIVQRLLNTDPAERAHGLSGLERLQKLQAFAGCAAACIYLFFNDWFIALWQGPQFHVPLSLQVAFALNLSVTMAGDAGIQVRGRLDIAGVRLGGLTVGGAGLLNLLLSLVAMKAGSIVGIAAATVVAQSLQSFVLGRSACAMLGLSWRAWWVKSWVAPLIAVSAFAALRSWLTPNTPLNIALLVLAGLVLLYALAVVLGLRWQFAVDEWKRLRASFH